MILSFLVSNFLSYSGNLNRGKKENVWYSHYRAFSSRAWLGVASPILVTMVTVFYIMKE